MVRILQILIYAFRVAFIFGFYCRTFTWSGFFTLLERKLLSYRSIRLGPNKVMLGGVIQPLLDGLKLFLKPLFHLRHSRWIIFIGGAWLAFSLNLMLWQVVQFFGFYSILFQGLWLLVITGLASYSVLLSGWSSSSKFGRLGGWRSLAQVLSFEVILVLVLILSYIVNFRFSWTSGFKTFRIVLFGIWFILVLAETQRAPLDLAEAERELVSGYNVEYGRFNFVLLFLAEYGNILIFSVFSRFYWGGRILIWTGIFLFFRRCYPRVRYDWHISIMWFVLLPNLVWVWGLFIWVSWV